MLAVLSCSLSTAAFVFAEEVSTSLREQVYVHDEQGRLKIAGDSCGNIPPTCWVPHTVPGQERNPRALGTECEDMVVHDLESQGAQVLGREITLVAARHRTRVDMIVKNRDGALEIIEVKCGCEAKLSSQQKAAFPIIQQSGAELHGKKASDALLPETIGPTPVRIIRVVTCP